MPKKTITISTDQVKHIAKLAHIPVSDEEAGALAHAFEETLAVVEHLKELDVTGVEPTHQVTGLENVWRDDVVDSNRMFTQAAALANAPAVHNGYFVVDQVIEQED